MSTNNCFNCDNSKDNLKCLNKSCLKTFCTKCLDDNPKNNHLKENQLKYLPCCSTVISEEDLNKIKNIKLKEQVLNKYENDAEVNKSEYQTLTRECARFLPPLCIFKQSVEQMGSNQDESIEKFREMITSHQFQNKLFHFKIEEMQPQRIIQRNRNISNHLKKKNLNAALKKKNMYLYTPDKFMYDIEMEQKQNLQIEEKPLTEEELNLENLIKIHDKIQNQQISHNLLDLGLQLNSVKDQYQSLNEITISSKLDKSQVHGDSKIDENLMDQESKVIYDIFKSKSNRTLSHQFILFSENKQIVQISSFDVDYQKRIQTEFSKNTNNKLELEIGIKPVLETINLDSLFDKIKIILTTNDNNNEIEFDQKVYSIFNENNDSIPKSIIFQLIDQKISLKYFDSQPLIIQRNKKYKVQKFDFNQKSTDPKMIYLVSEEDALNIINVNLNQCFTQSDFQIWSNILIPTDVLPPNDEESLDNLHEIIESDFDNQLKLYQMQSSFNIKFKSKMIEDQIVEFEIFERQKVNLQMHDDNMNFDSQDNRKIEFIESDQYLHKQIFKYSWFKNQVTDDTNNDSRNDDIQTNSQDNHNKNNNLLYIFANSDYNYFVLRYMKHNEEMNNKKGMNVFSNIIMKNYDHDQEKIVHNIFQQIKELQERDEQTNIQYLLFSFDHRRLLELNHTKLYALLNQFKYKLMLEEKPIQIMMTFRDNPRDFAYRDKDSYYHNLARDILLKNPDNVPYQMKISDFIQEQSQHHIFIGFGITKMNESKGKYKSLAVFTQSFGDRIQSVNYQHVLLESETCIPDFTALSPQILKIIKKGKKLLEVESKIPKAEFKKQSIIIHQFRIGNDVQEKLNINKLIDESDKIHTLLSTDQQLKLIYLVQFQDQENNSKIFRYNNMEIPQELLYEKKKKGLSKVLCGFTINSKDKKSSTRELQQQVLKDDVALASDRVTRNTYANLVFNLCLLSFSVGGHSSSPVFIHSAFKQTKKLVKIYQSWKALNNAEFIDLDGEPEHKIGNKFSREELEMSQEQFITNLNKQQIN